MIDGCMARTGGKSKVEEGLMGGKERGRGIFQGLGIAYVVEKHIFLKRRSFD